MLIFSENSVEKSYIWGRLDMFIHSLHIFEPMILIRRFWFTAPDRAEAWRPSHSSGLLRQDSAPRSGRGEKTSDFGEQWRRHAAAPGCQGRQSERDRGSSASGGSPGGEGPVGVHPGPQGCGRRQPGSAAVDPGQGRRSPGQRTERVPAAPSRRRQRSHGSDALASWLRLRCRLQDCRGLDSTPPRRLVGPYSRRQVSARQRSGRERQDLSRHHSSRTGDRTADPGYSGYPPVPRRRQIDIALLRWKT